MKQSSVKRQASRVLVNNKKFHFILKLVTRYSLFITVFILLTAYCLLPTIVEAQIAGKITKVEGRVDILRAAVAAAVPAKMGDTVNVGDILRTKSDGKAEITFIDNTTMTVGPKSRLGIEEYLYKPDEEKRSASLKLYRGRTGFQIPKPVYPAEGSKFEMKTKTAVAGVRGTEGIIHTDGVERVYVKDGVIEFSNPLGSVIVSKGEVGEVFLGRAPVERPYSEREYQQQERQVTPRPAVAEAPPAEVPPPPPPAPPRPPEIAPPPPGPPIDIRSITLNKRFDVSASILDGEIFWYNSTEGDKTAAVIQSGGSISGSFNQTILEGGYYSLDMSGSYAWDTSRSVAPAYASVDDWFYFFYSGNTSEGKPFYGASIGDIAVSNKSWSGGNIGWIEDGSKKYWYIGGLSGSYSNIFYNNNSGSRSGQSGTFSAAVDGLFWDGSRPFWEVFDKIIPTLPSKPDFFVPITETALRTFDISGSTHAESPLSLKNASGSSVGTMSASISGKGIELTPGSGLFDVNVNGSWSASTTIGNLREINGTIDATTSITGATVYNMVVEGGIKGINSTTAIVGADVRKSGDTDPAGVMIGKMTGSTSGTFDGKAIGEIKSGFLLP